MRKKQKKCACGNPVEGLAKFGATKCYCCNRGLASAHEHKWVRVRSATRPKACGECGHWPSAKDQPR